MLTDAGFAALAAAAPGHVEGVRRHLFDALSPAQVDQLRRISETLADTPDRIHDQYDSRSGLVLTVVG